MKRQSEIPPTIREIDTKLREVESGALSEAAEHQVRDSICRTLRAYLRQEYGLKEESLLKRCMLVRVFECFFLLS